MITLRTTFGDDLIDLFNKELNKKIKTGVRKGMSATGMFLVREIKKDLSKKSSGSKKDIRYDPKRSVWVSPAGKSPNNDTKELYNSVSWELRGDDAVFVGSEIKKGLWLEEGTKKMKPRPFIKSNAEKKSDQLTSVFEDRFLKYLDKGK